MKNHISVKFQDSEIAYRVIGKLLELERKNSKQFGYIMEWIQSLFEESHLEIGKSTVMDSTDRFVQKKSECILHLDDFLELRFQNRVVGRQIIITLMEMEARVEGALYGIMGGIEATFQNTISKQVSPSSSPLGKIIPFPKKNGKS